VALFEQKKIEMQKILKEEKCERNSRKGVGNMIFTQFLCRSLKHFYWVSEKLLDENI
jgi:hypothetical protein